MSVTLKRNANKYSSDMEKIDQILNSLYDRVIEPIEAKKQVLDLFAVIKSVCVHPFEKVYQSETECYCEICGHDFTQVNENNNIENEFYEFSFKIGDFQVRFDDKKKELKVIVLTNNLRMIIKPNSDNSCSIGVSR